MQATMKNSVNAAEQIHWKKTAAEAAAKLVENGMVIGLGTGSTAAFLVSALARRISEEGLRILGVPTSERTAADAQREGIPLTSLGEHVQMDLTIDGADEVEYGTLHLIKGRGGALLREKIVASASKRFVVIADETKLVRRLGSLFAVPAEVVQFGWQVTERKLQDLGAKTSLRLRENGAPFVTDGGNYIMDCSFGPMRKPSDIAERLDRVVGVVEHGLFLGIASQVFVGGRDGLKLLKARGAGSRSNRKA
jgi:ribose 5-phosphate isomerase A